MSLLGERTVIAIDPGSSKCGIAVVSRAEGGSQKILWRKIVPTSDIVQYIAEQTRSHSLKLVVVGGGTASNNVIQKLEKWLPHLGVLVVNEEDTTLNARERYWSDNPRSGWRRLLPASMQVPPVDIDDYAAVVIAERVLST